MRPDGGLDVTTTAVASGEGVGVRIVLPASYVAAHLTLAYAATVHAAQGQTVDSSHAVITPNTAHAALYVALSRGREANTAHIATLTAVEDPAQGTQQHTVHRDPVAVLAAILDQPDPIAAQSALALGAHSAAAATTASTPVELLADAAQLAATERTSRWLDHLTTTGVLTPAQRERIAAEDGAASLTRVLRRAEIAGLDPQQVLRDAISERPLDGASNTTNVLYTRITAGNTRRFDPVGTSFRDWIPTTGNPAWDTYLTALANAADHRTAELGHITATDPPAWAVEALGPVPDEPVARRDWEHRAGIVAAYREVREHDDPADALGRAPKPGQVEQYAAYRAAWTALGRPEIDRTLDELSDGQLRARIIAWNREQAWGPRYVGNDLAGTRQAATQQHHTATLRAAEAAATTDPDQAARLTQEAAEAAALAGVLDERVQQLEKLDDARAIWWAHTAETRAEADQSQHLLAERHADTEPEPTVTAEEWLTADHDTRLADDAHRTITELDLTPDLTEVHAADHDAATSAVEQDYIAFATTRSEPGIAPERGAEASDPAERDIREIAAAEPSVRNEDTVRVTPADDIAADLERATRAIAEVNAREHLDQREEREHRAAELARWHANDHTNRAAASEVDEAPARELAPADHRDE